MARDLTQKQFAAACERAGFKRELGGMGYYRLAPPCESTCVSVFNAGARRRDWLAYLHSQQQRFDSAKVKFEARS